MADLVVQLFEEYARRFAAGDRPDLRDYLARAGEQRDELALLADRFLQWAEPSEPDEDAIAVAQAWIDGEAPLVALRARRGVRRETVVDALMERFALAAPSREKLRRRYHQLETGRLEPAQLNPALLEEIAKLLRASVCELLALRPRPLAAEPAYYRAESKPPLPPAGPAAAGPEADEVDRLFFGADR